MTTDNSERGLKRLTCTVLTGSPCEPGETRIEESLERPAAYKVGWISGNPDDYDREYSLLVFLLHETESLDPFADEPSRKIASSDLIRVPYVTAAYRNVTPRTFQRIDQARTEGLHQIHESGTGRAGHRT